MTIGHIAKGTGVCRDTAARRLRAKDVKIVDYMNLCCSVGVDPIANLNAAIETTAQSDGSDSQKKGSMA